MKDELNVLYEEGLKKGLTIGVDEFDDLISFEKNRLCIISGIPGHGKSEFLDYLLVKLNILYGWKTGYFSPENFPIHLHASKIIEKLSGKKFIKSELDPILYRHTVEYANDNFFFIRPEKDYKIETILSRASYLIAKEGISAFVIDPYNKLDHQFTRGRK